MVRYGVRSLVGGVREAHHGARDTVRARWAGQHLGGSGAVAGTGAGECTQVSLILQNQTPHLTHHTSRHAAHILWLAMGPDGDCEVLVWFLVAECGMLQMQYHPKRTRCTATWLAFAMVFTLMYVPAGQYWPASHATHCALMRARAGAMRASELSCLQSTAQHSTPQRMTAQQYEGQLAGHQMMRE